MILTRRALALATVAFLTPFGARALPPEETAPIHFVADLSADEESAPTESPGSGHAEFTLERATLKFSWVVTFDKLTSPLTEAVVRGPQKPGTNAGVLFELGPKTSTSPIKGSIVLNDGQLEYLLAGRMYVNLHTTKYKDGELRGQIHRVRETPQK
jgi:hypothetical protein